jgi:hypothetical protein
MASIYSPYANQMANQYGISPTLFSNLITQESAWNPSAIGPVTRFGSAIGLTQLLPSTAAGLGVNPYDPYQNIEGGAKYLSQMIGKYGREDYALAAYNWGPGNVDNWISRGASYAGLPNETQNYLYKILGPDFNPDANRAGVGAPGSYDMDALMRTLGGGLMNPAITGVGLGAAQTARDQATGWLGGLTSWFKGINNSVESFIMRVAFILMGLIVVAVALYMLGNRSTVVVAVAQKVKGAVNGTNGAGV